MDAKGSFLTVVSLLFFLGFQHPAAHPIHSLSPAEELANMEALLERLEEKVALMEDLQGNPDDSEARGDRPAEEDMDDEPLADDFPVFSDRTALLKHMRGIQAAKSLRESGCFGRRLDRIGSVSGMGCKVTQNFATARVVAFLIQEASSVLLQNRRSFLDEK